MHGRANRRSAALTLTREKTGLAALMALTSPR